MPVTFGQATERAIKHLTTFGDTDLFPSLPEMRCYSENVADVAAALELLTVGNYKPSGCVETLTPKTWLGFRIAHQLSATDNIVYLASVISAAEKLESSRQSANNMRAVAYRYKAGTEARIFSQGRSFHDWINYLSQFGAAGNPFTAEKSVIITDISDFYSRIYFHRVENILSDAGVDLKAAGLIKKVVQKARAKQSFGIPVGSSASRLIAECVLNDTDRFIENLGLESTRYVDDFRILVDSELAAHSSICKIAEHLMVTEGLSLNVSKTHFQTVPELHKSAKKRLQDVFTSKEMLEIEQYIRLNYGDDEVDAPDEDDVARPIFMTADDLMDRMRDMVDKKVTDIAIYKAILRALRFMPDVNLMKLIDEQSELLYYIPREFCLLIRAAFSNASISNDHLKQKLIQLVNMPPFSDMVFVRSWILDLFACGPVNINPSDLVGYDFTRSIYEKRYELLLKGRFDDKAYFRAKRSHFSEFSDWEKPSVLMGAMCLPKDEYCTWIDTLVDDIPGPLSKIFIKWLKEKHGNLAAILDTVP